MKSEVKAEKIVDFLAAGYAGFVVRTAEAKRGAEVLTNVVENFNRKDGKKHKVMEWDLDSTKGGRDPVRPLTDLEEAPELTVAILHNYHWFLKLPQVIQKIQNSIEEWQHHGKAIIILTPFPEIPLEIRKDFMLLELPLPDEAEILSCMQHIANSAGKPELMEAELEPVVQAAKGLTKTEVENVLALSYVTKMGFDVPTINEQKIQTIEKSGLIEVLRTDKNYDDILGYDKAKNIVGKMIIKRTSKGVLFVGPPGCLAGDTKIRVNRNGKGYETNIKSLYERVNGIKYPLKSGNPTKVRSYDGETIQLQEILGVIYSGKKDILRLELENGRSIKATPDHRIMTKNGWVEMENIEIGDFIMCDTLLPKKNAKNKPSKKKPDYRLLWGALNHPNAKTKANEDGIVYAKIISKHRAVYEAHMNGLSFVDFMKIIKGDAKKAKELKYLSNNDIIHHLDGDILNNRIKNLKKMTDSEHKSLHCKEGTKFNFGQGIPTYSKAVDVEYVGVEDTYDIQCPIHHNFVASGIVVHNCGKTLFVECTVGQFQKIGLLINFGRLYSKY